MTEPKPTHNGTEIYGLPSDRSSIYTLINNREIIDTSTVVSDHVDEQKMSAKKADNKKISAIGCDWTVIDSANSLLNAECDIIDMFYVSSVKNNEKLWLVA